MGWANKFRFGTCPTVISAIIFVNNLEMGWGNKFRFGTFPTVINAINFANFSVSTMLPKRWCNLGYNLIVPFIE